jgi:hypothetical protein
MWKCNSRTKLRRYGGDGEMKQQIVHALQKYVLNPPIKLLFCYRPRAARIRRELCALFSAKRILRSAEKQRMERANCKGFGIAP